MVQSDCIIQKQICLSIQPDSELFPHSIRSVSLTELSSETKKGQILSKILKRIRFRLLPAMTITFLK